MSSPYINHFLQPDSLIPDPSNPQAWNRYSYVGNRPVNLNDPTGHKACDDVDENGKCFTSLGNLTRSTKKVSTDIMEAVPPPCLTCIFKPDAYYISLGLAAGVGPWYGAVSIDMVVTDDEIGVFKVFQLGPGFKGGKYFPLGQLAGYESTFMTPQIGTTLYCGGLWGDSIKKSVLNYEGGALIVGAGGGSGFGLDAEYFSSVDPRTGVVNGDVQGFGIGPSIGPQPAEFHITYSDAVFDPGLSYAATTIGRWLEIIQP